MSSLKSGAPDCVVAEWTIRPGVSISAAKEVGKMASELIVVFGGSGFLGRYVVKALAKRGYRVRVPIRRPHLGQELRVMGDVGQIHLMQANVRYPDSVAAALEGADGVVNLVGVLYETGKQNFKAMHVDAAETIARAAARKGVRKMVQVSAIGDPRGRSNYAKSKGRGEEVVRAALPAATILRPSILFGPEDNFLNRFAAMARSAPFLPLIGGGKTKFQPVHVQDVADAIVGALERPEAAGRIYELGGPRVYSFRQLMRFILATIQRKRMLLGLPFFLAEPLGGLMAFGAKILPFPPMLTADQVRSLKSDNVVGAGGKVGTLADLGVTQLETLETIVPTYLWKYRPYGQFQTTQQA
jgi:NADH dehydrogenase